MDSAQITYGYTILSDIIPQAHPLLMSLRLEANGTMVSCKVLLETVAYGRHGLKFPCPSSMNHHIVTVNNH